MVLAGRKRAGLAEHTVVVDLGTSPTLADLIGAVVTASVTAFDARREERSFVSVLTESALEDSVSAGAVRSGGTETPPPPPLAEAVATALLAFTDGLFQVFVDEEPVENLESKVSVGEGTRLLFLRLVALAGG